MTMFFKTNESIRFWSKEERKKSIPVIRTKLKIQCVFVCVKWLREYKSTRQLKTKLNFSFLKSLLNKLDLMINDNRKSLSNENRHIDDKYGWTWTFIELRYLSRKVLFDFFSLFVHHFNMTYFFRSFENNNNSNHNNDSR